jgi:chemotaxis protein CheZ
MVNARFPRARNAVLMCTLYEAGRHAWSQNVQRRVFRVEQMIGPGRARNDAQPFQIDNQTAREESTTAPEAALAAELSALRVVVARNTRALMDLVHDGKNRRMARAAGELAAAVESMESATQKVLASVEVIDDCARALVSTLTDDYHQGLAQDVQDHVVRIYEACNFQDLAGQRIGKVIATLVMVEEQLAAMIDNCSGAGTSGRLAGSPAGQELLNGPRLDGESGHASQQDIDLMFA